MSQSKGEEACVGKGGSLVGGGADDLIHERLITHTSEP